ncbi:Flagellar transcriptional regulator FlhD [Methylibium sp. T29-B]|nr:Flagellar transcriptional regulator FlhD [Methylibium sp. T29-B]
MNTEQILIEIREANLSYLMLAQSLIRADRDQALFRLGISEETADLIGLLSPAQMMKIASGNTLLCRMRVDERWCGAC